MDPGQAIGVFGCEPAPEVPAPEGTVPHWLPGTNPNLHEFANWYGLPFEATRGGAETLYPEYRSKLRDYKPPEKCERYCACLTLFGGGCNVPRRAARRPDEARMRTLFLALALAVSRLRQISNNVEIQTIPVQGNVTCWPVRAATSPLRSATMASCSSTRNTNSWRQSHRSNSEAFGQADFLDDQYRDRCGPYRW